MKNLMSQLKEHEGFRDNYYLCTSNKRTIGYGRNVDDNPFNDDEMSGLGRNEFEDVPMTEKEAHYLLLNDVINAGRSINKSGILPKFNELNKARFAVVINMVFNMGFSRFSKFEKTIAFINEGDFETASIEMLNSRWAKQVPSRAQELSVQMLLGEFD